MNRALGLDRAVFPLRVSPPRVVPAKVTMRDDRLPHQIRLTFTGAPSSAKQVAQIAVSCTCQATGGSGPAGPVYRPLTQRARWDDPAGPMRIWREHMDEIGAKERANA